MACLVSGTCYTTAMNENEIRDRMRGVRREFSRAKACNDATRMVALEAEHKALANALRKARGY